MRTVAGPAGRPGTASGVGPISRSLTNTFAPAGLDSTVIDPTSEAAPDEGRAAVGRSGISIDALGRAAVNRTRRSAAEKPSRASRMVYDPSARSRTVSGVFP